jgi:signal transduction histidine kinase
MLRFILSFFFICLLFQSLMLNSFFFEINAQTISDYNNHPNVKRIKDLISDDKYDEVIKLLYSEKKIYKNSAHELKRIYFYEGKALSYMADYNQAMAQLKRSLTFQSTDILYNRYYDLITYYSMADLYYTNQIYDSAYFFAEKSLLKNFDRFHPAVFAYCNEILIAKDYDSKNYDISRKRAKIVFDFYNELDEKDHLSVLAYKMVKIYAYSNQIDSAQLYLQFAKKTIDDQIKEWDDFTIYNQYTNFYKHSLFLAEQENDLNKQITFLKAIDSLRNNYTFLNEKKLINELNIKFKSKEKETENKSLQSENKQLNKILTLQKVIVYICVIFLILFGLFLLVISIKNRKINDLNKQFSLKNNDLERQHVLNQQIFSVISHDFKGPISTLLILLNKKIDLKKHPDLVDEYMKDISSQIEHADNMLNNLLEWAKNELGIQTNQNIVEDLHALIAMICKQLNKSSNEKKLQIINDVPSLTEISFSKEVLTIIIRNILSNAIKFSYDFGKIIISSTVDSISITDFGVGISKKDLPKLFNYKMDPNLGTNHEIGFGIGMYFSSELATKHGAKLEVESEEGKYTRFIIRFNNPNNRNSH